MYKPHYPMHQKVDSQWSSRLRCHLFSRTVFTGHGRWFDPPTTKIRYLLLLRKFQLVCITKNGDSLASRFSGYILNVREQDNEWKGM